MELTLVGCILLNPQLHPLLMMTKRTTSYPQELDTDCYCVLSSLSLLTALNKLVSRYLENCPRWMEFSSMAIFYRSGKIAGTESFTGSIWWGSVSWTAQMAEVHDRLSYPSGISQRHLDWLSLASFSLLMMDTLASEYRLSIWKSRSSFNFLSTSSTFFLLIVFCDSGVVASKHHHHLRTSLSPQKFVIFVKCSPRIPIRITSKLQ